MEPVSSNINANGLASEAASARDDIKYLRSILSPDKSGRVNEEQLFAGIIQERIKVLKGEPAAAKFETLFERFKRRIGKKANVIENAARRALRALIAERSIGDKLAQRIHSEASAAAQLDANKDMLYDSIGGKGDTTISTEMLDRAVAQAIRKLNSFDAGRAIPMNRPITDVIHNPGQR